MLFFFANGIEFLWARQTADSFVQMLDEISSLWRTPFGGIVVSMSSAYYAILSCVSYITYIPMAKGFVYLVAVMDWYSRRVLSWRVSTTMDADFCIDALKEAIDN